MNAILKYCQWTDCLRKNKHYVSYKTYVGGYCHKHYKLVKYLEKEIKTIIDRDYVLPD